MQPVNQSCDVECASDASTLDTRDVSSVPVSALILLALHKKLPNTPQSVALSLKCRVGTRRGVRTACLRAKAKTAANSAAKFFSPDPSCSSSPSWY